MSRTEMPFPRRELTPTQHQQIRDLLIREAGQVLVEREPVRFRVVIPAAAFAVAAAVAGTGLVLHSSDDPTSGPLTTASATAPPTSAPAVAPSSPAATTSVSSSGAASAPASAATVGLIPADGSGLTRCLSFSGEGHLLAVASDTRVVRLYDTTDPAKPRRLAGFDAKGDWTASLALSPDGRLLATSADRGTVRIWDVSNPRSPVLRQTLPTTTQYVPDLVFSPDGRTLATAGYDNKVKLWNVAGDSLTLRAVLATATGDIMAVAFGPDGTQLAAASYAKVSLWNLAGPGGPRVESTLPTTNTGLVDVAFSPGGRTLAIADGAVKLWDVTDFAKPKLSATLRGVGRAVAFDTAGPSAATMDDKGRVTVWDLSRPAAPVSVAQPAMAGGGTADDRGLVFSADGDTLAASRDAGGVGLIAVP